MAGKLGLKKVAQDEGLEPLSQPTPIDEIAETLQQHFADE